jgi:chemosensory pili system protein ChpA (sensor histidine kinase/response regulator)
MASIQTVLVVEDSPDIAALEAELIANGGRRAIIVADGVEALAVLADTLIDLIVLDLNLPLLTGQEVLGRLSTRQRLSHIPVVVVSANLSGFRATPQVVGVVGKPFEIAEFAEAVDRALLPFAPARLDPADSDPII